MSKLNFQLEVMNILETRFYEINDEKRIPVIKTLLGWGDCSIWRISHPGGKMTDIKPQTELLSVLCNRVKLHHNHIIL